MMNPSTTAVTVLLATYNGERFLDEQLDSIDNQDVERINIIASDDGSKDGTSSILTDWKQRWSRGDFQVLHGPQRGFAANFRSLLAVAPDSGYVAFSDQDDVWHPNKLSCALSTIARSGERPALYCSRTALIDERGAPVGKSPLFGRPPSFKNALVQSIAGGNTMVLNQAATRLLRHSTERTTFRSHDWWAYLLVSGAGGLVHYDSKPKISYRQHDANLVGRNTGLTARVRRAKNLMAGHFKGMIDHNIAALNACNDLLSQEARTVLEQFEDVRRLPPIVGLTRLRRIGLYRQTPGADIGLWLATLLRKL